MLPVFTRRRILCAATALTVAIVPVVVDGSNPASAMPTAALAPTAVHLVGTDNTRDFTAYRTVDGHSITSLAIRSDNLSRITPADAAALSRRRVTEIVDLRTSIERSVQPDRPVPGAALRNYDVLGASPVTTLVDIPSAYRAFITDPGARLAFRRTLLDIASTAAHGHAVVFHCTQGKDRTGWAAAVLLTILGVDRATVERDYLASNVFRHASPNDPVNGVSIGWLRTSFATANQMFGSFDDYVHRGLGLTDRDITALKSALLTRA